MKIGVFDSGIGGRSVTNAIKTALPTAEVIFRHDTPEHFPYATKSPNEIYGYVAPILEELIQQGCEVIVIACNTVSTTLIEQIREQLPQVPFIAMEPMVKPAAEQTKSGIVAICATPTTLASKRYQWLKHAYAAGVTVLEPNCSDWSYLIEHNRMNDVRIRTEIEPALTAGADVIVLGCTHYHWIEQEIKTICKGRAIVLQPEAAVVRQLKRVLGLQS